MRGLPTARSEGAGSSASWTWDPVERLASQGHAFTSGDGNVSSTFAYSPAAQIVTRTRSNDAYAADPPDASVGYTVNGLNQYTAVAGTPFAYDANGNLTSDGSRTYTYDVENRLVGASGGVTLTYDPLGRLWEVAGPSDTTRLLWDGDMLLAEYGGNNAFRRRYTHGSGAGDDPLLWAEAGGTTRWLHADHQGSIVAIAGAGGGTYRINAYDSWGLPDPGHEGRFGFTGQIWLPELGMYHYKARVYSPTLGRFLQTDPVGYDDQVNLYAYVGNDPVNLADPTGESCDTGSRLGEAAQCRVDMDYMQMDFSSDPARGPHGPRAFGGGGNSERGILRSAMDDLEETATNISDLATVQMRETRGRGITGETVAREALEAGGFRILGSQVHVRDIQGNLRIVDFIVAGGPSGMLGVEVKYGNNTRGVRQRTIDARIRLQGGRIVSRNQPNFSYGQRVQFGTIEINPRLVRVP